MRKHYFLFLFAMISVVGFAQRNVTFQVDMKNQSVTGSVYVAGSFNSWNGTANALSQVGTTTIYSATISIADGDYQYKFINGGSWENPPNTCNVDGGYGADNGNGNRWLAIVSDTTLPAILFDDCAPDGMVAAQLMVDMNQQAANDTVSVAGSFQGWSPGSTIMSNVASDSVYRAMVYANANDTIYYKFVNGTAWGQEESVPSACEVNGNRELIIAANTNAGPVCYGMCTGCPAAPIPQYNMTLMLDMQNHLACNMMDSLDVAGTLNGWAGGDLLTDMGNNIWAVTMLVDSGEVEFKFRSHLGGNVGWEGVPNRVAVHSMEDTVRACFNVDGLGAYCNPIPGKADVTFRVDMATWGGSIDTAGVYVMGDFTSWQTNAIQMTPLPGGIYEATVTDFCPGSMYFKFVNGTPDASNSSNEENAGLDSTCARDNGVGGMNRFYERTNGNDITFDLIFDSCSGMNISINEDEKTDIVKMYPNPMTNSAWIELTDGTFEISVLDLSGRTIKSMSDVSGKVEISRENLTSGLYIVTVTNDKGVASSAKLIVE